MDSCHLQRSARTPDEHLAHVIAVAGAHLPARELPLLEATGEVLVENLRARLAVPAFSNSAMDGFLVHEADLQGEGPWTLPVAGDVPAGAQARSVPAGQTIRIMTGAPTGEDTAGLMVVPVELTTTPAGPTELPREVTVTQRPGKTNIRPRGKDKQVGDLVAAAGARIDAGLIAAAVSTGHASVRAIRKPRVAVISSGDELATPGDALQPGQIPDSNGPMVAALVHESGAEPHLVAHTADCPEDFQRTLAEAASSCDLVITTGGVSAGAFDVVKEVAGSEAGVWFGHVRQQPGKPQGVGTVQGTPLIALPGNPVSSFVSFHLYARPMIAVLAGRLRPNAEVDEPSGRPGPQPRVLDRPTVVADLVGKFPADAKRTRFVPVTLAWRDGRATATRSGEGSHFVASLAGVTGLAVIPAVSEGGREETPNQASVILL